MSESNVEQPSEREPLPKPIPAYLPTTGSPLTVDKELYTKIRSAPRVLVEDFRLEIRSGRASISAVPLLVWIFRYSFYYCNPFCVNLYPVLPVSEER